MPWTLVVEDVGRRGYHTELAQRTGNEVFEQLKCEVICFGRADVTKLSDSVPGERFRWNLSLADPKTKAVDKVDAWFQAQSAFVPLLQICSDGMFTWLELSGLSESDVERVDAVLVQA